MSEKITMTADIFILLVWLKQHSRNPVYCHEPEENRKSSHLRWWRQAKFALFYCLTNY